MFNYINLINEMVRYYLIIIIGLFTVFILIKLYILIKNMIQNRIKQKTLKRIYIINNELQKIYNNNLKEFNKIIKTNELYLEYKNRKLYKD
tara:strand:+ start:18155 stop:18427 length:273 start_codon:yes stop_codon:yes gene_type:complete